MVTYGRVVCVFTNGSLGGGRLPYPFKETVNAEELVAIQ